MTKEEAVAAIGRILSRRPGNRYYTDMLRKIRGMSTVTQALANEIKYAEFDLAKRGTRR